MSGADIKGAQQGATITQKHRPNYSDDPVTHKRKMEKESTVGIDVRAPQVSRIKIGIRIKTYEKIDSLQIKGKGTPLMLWKETDPFPSGEPPLSGGQPSIVTQLKAIYDTDNPDGTPTGDQWIGFIAKYDPADHGTKIFDTDLVVNPVDKIPANGFQPVTIAFTTEGNRFETDHYIVATSILPGEDSTFAHMAITLNKKKVAASKKKTSKAKTAKKKKRKR
jgi:hypothetical protein